MSEAPKLRLAIVGGGIGGMTLAVALSHLRVDKTIQVDIYESAGKISQVGAGISVWPRGWETLKGLDLGDDLAAFLAPGQDIPRKDKERLSLVMKKGDHPQDVDIFDLVIPGGSLTFHRADMLSVLLKHISPNITVHLGHRLKSYSESKSGVELAFVNETSAWCDILVGADGINSVVRRGFLASEYNLNEEDSLNEARPVWTGTTVYRSVFPSERIKERNPKHPALSIPLSQLGKHKHIVAYPISGGKEINAVAFFTDPEKVNTYLEGPSVTPQTTVDVSALYTNWSADVKCITDNMINPSRWAIEMVKPLDKYGAGRVLLLGDSAHAMPPHMGNGAGQAFEDAYILAHLLSVTISRGPIAAEDISKIIQVYNTVRQPFGNFVAKASVDQGQTYEFMSEELADVREGDELAKERLDAMGKKIMDGFSWTWTTSVNDDLGRALALI